VSVEAVLCADCIYGDRSLSHLLVDTLCDVCAYGALCIAVFEKRYGCDQGASFIQELHSRGFATESAAHLVPANITQGCVGKGVRLDAFIECFIVRRTG
jgi:hypothetical protein